MPPYLPTTANGRLCNMTDRKPLSVDTKADKAKPAKSAAASKDTKDQGNGQKTSPKKRRKVNHACVYCRRSVSNNTLWLHSRPC